MTETQSRKYNGKEFVEAHGYDTYDYGARGYYPAIMRFTTVDPLAEKYYSISPYAYCAGNPVNRIDPTGLDWYYNDENEFPTYIPGNEDNKKYKHHSKTAFRESENLKYYFGEGGSIMIVEKLTGDAMTYLPETVVKPSGGGYTNYNSYSYVGLNEMMGDGNRDGGHSAADWLGLTSSVADPIGGGADKILINRGAYMPRGGIYKANIPITVRTPIVNINTTSKVLNGVRVVGKVAAVAGVAVTIGQVTGDVLDGKYIKATARGTVAIIGAASNAIPYVGPLVSIGISYLDFKYGDSAYESLESSYGHYFY